MQILVAKDNRTYLGNDDFELVERKGVGHPDTICDAIAERASSDYSKYCIETFGKPAHHWFDKVMLIGGEADVDYGIGKITKPYKVIFAGKVSYHVGTKRIPVEDILYKSAVCVLEEVLTGFDAKCHLVVVNELVDYQGSGRGTSRYQPSSVEALPSLNNPELVSNDSNLLSAYAPLTTLESLVLLVERFVNGKDFKMRNPDTGWDVKVLGNRFLDHYELLLNMPFLAKDIHSMEEYLQRKQDVYDEITKFISEKFDIKVHLMMNATDRNGRPYLTALGSVADTGDVGVVGRGNRMNGLITPMRPMSIEAPAGKNPIDHTGKIYGVVANEIAYEVYKAIKMPVEVYIFTAKESRLNNTDRVIVKVINFTDEEREKKIIEQIVKEQFDNIGHVSEKIIYDRIVMW